MNFLAVFVTAILFSLSAVSRGDEIASAAIAEMKAGKTKLFDVAGESRARPPVEFTLRYPQGWGTSPVARKGVAGRVASSNGEGMDSFVVVMTARRDEIKNATPDEIFTKDYFKQFDQFDAKMFRRERLKEGTFDGGIMEYLMETEKPPMKIRMYVCNYLFAHKGSVVQVQFYTLLGDGSDKKADNRRIAAFKPLWKAIAQTIKLR